MFCSFGRSFSLSAWQLCQRANGSALFVAESMGALSEEGAEAETDLGGLDRKWCSVLNERRMLVYASFSSPFPSITSLPALFFSAGSATGPVHHPYSLICTMRSSFPEKREFFDAFSSRLRAEESCA